MAVCQYTSCNFKGKEPFWLFFVCWFFYFCFCCSKVEATKLRLSNMREIWALDAILLDSVFTSLLSINAEEVCMLKPYIYIMYTHNRKWSTIIFLNPDSRVRISVMYTWVTFELQWVADFDSSVSVNYAFNLSRRQATLAHQHLEKRY